VLAAIPSFTGMNRHEALAAYLRESDALQSASRLLQWDQEVMMPPMGDAARSEALAALAKVHHERATSAQLEELARESAQAAQAGSPEARQAELALRDLERNRKVPICLAEDLAKTCARSQAVWQKAREARDFKLFRPHLEEVVRLKRAEGECLRIADQSSYDALLNDYEFGMGTREWDALLDALEPRLLALLPKVLERQEGARKRVAACTALRGPFADAEQMEAGKYLATAIGYDFAQGRLDLSVHPFSETMHAGDSRITTRLDPTDLTSSFFSVLHETGHALYEQGLPPQWAGTPLGMAVSMAVHESQSRLWENIVGRSRAFWTREKPDVDPLIPQFKDVPLETFLEAANLVRPSLIRTESDEVTYNLHVLIRYRLEKLLISGDLAVADLPQAWDDAYEATLGIRPANDVEGLMQDVHWPGGSFGYFPTYTLGNLLSAQFHAAAAKMVDVNDPAALRGWLRREIHSRAHLLDTRELVRTVTGAAPSAEAFVAYLETKYLA
jgi:carboxypeptidase Taq